MVQGIMGCAEERIGKAETSYIILCKLARYERAIQQTCSYIKMECTCDWFFTFEYVQLMINYCRCKYRISS